MGEHAALRVCALRELFEETGLLLSSRHHTSHTTHTTRTHSTSLASETVRYT